MRPFWCAITAVSSMALCSAIPPSPRLSLEHEIQQAVEIAKKCGKKENLIISGRENIPAHNVIVYTLRVQRNNTLFLFQYNDGDLYLPANHRQDRHDVLDSLEINVQGQYAYRKSGDFIQSTEGIYQLSPVRQQEFMNILRQVVEQYRGCFAS